MNKLGHRFSNFAFSLLATVTILIGSVPLVPSAYGITVNTGINEAGEWHRAGPGVVMRETNEPGVDIYIVRHQAPSLAQYRGDIPGLAATSPVATGAARLDTDSAASQAYLDYLAGLHNNLKASIGSRIGRDVEMVHRYDAVLNGIAVRMTAAEAQQVSSLAGVRSVTRDYSRQLLTDVGPHWIGADTIWGTTDGPDADTDGDFPSITNTCINGTCGEGIVVGIIDTGVNFNHPSFADVGDDGYDHTNPRGQFYGVCDPVTGLPFCNDKLIGYYDFTGTGPEDDHGHGSHTGSTTAGNVLNITLKGNTIDLDRSIAGVAPHANVISYKGCSGTPAGCQLSALIGSINMATNDEVDVINYSIGGGSANPWEDLDAQAFFDAYTAGIFVATSASNDGPGYATLGSPADAPWVTSVGASTHDRQIANGIVGLSPVLADSSNEIFGAGITAGYPSAEYPHLDESGASNARIVYAGDFPSDKTATPELCGAGAANAADGTGSDGSPWPAATFNGEIVLCLRGDYGRVMKGQYVMDAGAGGYILMNDEANGESLVADNHVLPGVHISYANGDKLRQLIAANGGNMSTVTGQISGMNPRTAPENADIMASFSSRGANPAAPSLIKPDVTAPGVDVLAAWMASPEVTLQDILLQTENGEQYNIISGTSMSSPHTAGAGALIRAVHPDWSPDEVKSALMTTAFTDTLPGNGAEVRGVVKEDGVTPADPFDMGAGRVDLHVAAQAGFVLDETVENYEVANPSVGGDATALNIASLGQDFCPSSCTWTRTIKGTAPGSVSWTASGSSADGLNISITPSSFTLAEGETQTLTFVASVENVTNTTAQGWAFGEVQFSNSASVPPAHFPVAVKPEAGAGVKFYLHGNTHDSDTERDCTGNGNGDATDTTNCRPFLSEAETQETAPPATYSQATGLDCVPNATSTCLHDPNWIWKLDGTTSLQGPMQFGFWFSNPESNPGLAEDFDIKIWADGALVFEQRFRADNEITQVGPVPYYMTGTATLPLMTADRDFLFIIDPVFVNQQGSVLYDSQAPCPGKIAGSCEGFVSLPVIDRQPQPPTANDDNAFVTNGGSVAINVLANDTDPEGGPLAVRVLTQPTNGTAEVGQFHEVTYTHNGSATTDDSFTYEVTDNQGLKDTATVNIAVGGRCQIAGGTAQYDFEGTIGDAQGWTVETPVNFGVVPWNLLTDSFAQEGSWVWYTDAAGQDGSSDITKDDRLISPSQLVSGNSIMSFSHKYLTEPGFDGGVLEVLIDGESNWRDIEAAGGVFISGGYDGILEGPARNGWNGTSTVYPEFHGVQVALANLAGESIQVRFRMLTDPLLGLPPGAGGWWVDDVSFSNLLINDPNCDADAVVAADDSANVNEGGSVVTDVTGNDSDPNASISSSKHTVTIVSAPSLGMAEVEGLQVIYYHTDDPYVSGKTTDSYKYELRNKQNGKTDTATVTVDINPAPRAEDDTGIVDANGSVEIDVRDNDRDLNDGKMALSVSVDNNGEAIYGTVTVTGPGTVDYQHNGDPNATEDMFTYTVTDPNGASSTATVTMTIEHDGGGGGGEAGEGRVHGSGYWDTNMDGDDDSDSDSDKLHFSFDAKVYKGGYKGKLKIRDKYMDLKIDAKSITSLSTGAGELCDGALMDGSTTFLFTATGKMEVGDDEVENAEFRACGADNGKNKKNPVDILYVECTANCLIPDYNTSTGAGNYIAGGNIHLHDPIVDNEPATAAADEGAAPESGGAAPESESGAPEGDSTAPEGEAADTEEPGSADVVTLAPMLFTEAPAGTPIVVTAIVETHGGLAADAEVTLNWRMANGLTNTATAVVNELGIASFVVTVPAGSTHYSAVAGGVESNGMNITGF